ncbi:MAG: hypothetical protein M3137_14060 [Actinomycetota bacterium]|nr:hypothetical protein [Actinomycetota bacterium]
MSDAPDQRLRPRFVPRSLLRALDVPFFRAPTIDARYWPVITHSVHYNADAWRDFNQSFDAGATLDWTGLDVEEVVRGADSFATALTTSTRWARSSTSCGAPIPGRGRPCEATRWWPWTRRVASEALDSFADDNGRQVPQGEIDATPTPGVAPQHPSAHDGRSLDRVGHLAPPLARRRR